MEIAVKMTTAIRPFPAVVSHMIRLFTLGSVVRCCHFDLSARKKQSKNSLVAKDIFTASLS